MADLSKIKAPDGTEVDIKDATARSGLADKMDKANPTGAGSLSINRKSGTTVGSYSTALGYNGTASGNSSHAEGRGCTAAGSYSHAEGRNSSTDSAAEAAHAEGYGSVAYGTAAHAEGFGCTATGNGSHAEGNDTITEDGAAHSEGEVTQAKGYASHTEGYYTIANGLASHTEGYHTIASGHNQHVSGKYNIEDSNNEYAEIIGNGSDNDNRSNARTLDWDGNERIAGNLEFMESSITGANIPGIYWKEYGYGDAFKIVPSFAGSGASNTLNIQASTGGAGVTPSLSNIATISAETGGTKIYGTTPTFNLGSTTIDTSQSNNGVSSNAYVGTYYQDKDNRNFAKVTPVILPSGGVILEMYAQNFNTSGTSVGSNTVQLSMDKNGSSSVYLSNPGAWLNALGQFGGLISGMVNWRNYATIRTNGGTIIGLLQAGNGLWTFYGGGGSHSSMTPTLTRIGGANADPSMTITHGSSYSEFKLQFSGSATWMFIGTVYGHDNDKSNNQFY